MPGTLVPDGTLGIHPLPPAKRSRLYPARYLARTIRCLVLETSRTAPLRAPAGPPPERPISRPRRSPAQPVASDGTGALRPTTGHCRATMKGMTSRSGFTPHEARAAGERIGIDWGSAPFNLEQFQMGMDVELEHGARDPQTNVTDDDVIITAKIARAHLNEFPDYYTRLAKMEAEAEAETKRNAQDG